jgi:hypothetical protein
MQAFNIGQRPVLEIENDGLGTIQSNIVPQLFVGTCDMYGEMVAQSASQRLGYSRIFLQKNNTLSHTSPDLGAR